MDFRIEEFTARDVVFTRRFGPYETMAPAAWASLWSWLRDNGHGAQVKRVIGIGWDNPTTTPAAERRYDACVELHERVSGDPGVEFALQTLPGGLYAVHQMKGPYHQMADVFRDLLDSVLPERGLFPDTGRPCMEIYINDPTEVPADELLTDLCIPVER